MKIQIHVAQPEHAVYAQPICDLMAESAKARGTGIATRKPEYIEEKLRSGKAIVALVDGELAGFSYIETWSHGKYVANSGLIVNPKFRRHGLARKIKAAIFNLFSELTQDDAFWAGCNSCPNVDILERNQRQMCLCTAMMAASGNEAKKSAIDLSDMIIEG